MNLSLPLNKATVSSHIGCLLMMLCACSGPVADGHPNAPDKELPNAVPQWLPSPRPSPPGPSEWPILWNYERPTPEGFGKARALVKSHDLCGNFGRVALEYRPFDVMLSKRWEYLREIRGQYIPLIWRGKNFYLLRDFEVVADPAAFATQRKADGANQPRSRHFDFALSDTISFSENRDLDQDRYKDDLSPVTQVDLYNVEKWPNKQARISKMAEGRPYSELMSPVYYGVAFVEAGTITLSKPASERLNSAFSVSASGLQQRMIIQPDIIVDADKLVSQPPITYTSPGIDEAIFGRLMRVAQIDDVVVYHMSNGRNSVVAVLFPDQPDAVYMACS